MKDNINDQVYKASHSFDFKDVFDSLETSEKGLSEQAVAENRLEFGENALPLAPPKP